MNMFNKSLLAAVLVAFAAPAIAGSFSQANGTGFIGVSDMKSATGWNTATLNTKTRAGVVSFAWRESVVYSVNCSGTQLSQTVNTYRNIKHWVGYDAKNNVKFFNLVGYSGLVTSDGVAPVAGGTCSTGSSTGTVVSATASAGTGALVTSDGQSIMPL